MTHTDRTRSDRLADDGEAARSQRERRTAVTAAFRELIRTGTGRPSAALAQRLTERHDGTTATLRDRASNPTTSTTNRED